MRARLRKFSNGKKIMEAVNAAYQYTGNQSDNVSELTGRALRHGECHKTSGLARFGYITMEAEKDNLLCLAGRTLKAHEFHYYDSTLLPDAFTAKKAGGSACWKAGVADKRMYAGFPHLYFYGNKEAAYAFVRTAKEYGHRAGI